MRDHASHSRLRRQRPCTWRVHLCICFFNAPSRHAEDDQNVLGSKAVLFDVVSALFLKSVMCKGETVLEFGNPCLDS